MFEGAMVSSAVILLTVCIRRLGSKGSGMLLSGGRRRKERKEVAIVEYHEKQAEKRSKVVFFGREAEMIGKEGVCFNSRHWGKEDAFRSIRELIPGRIQQDLETGLGRSDWYTQAVRDDSSLNMHLFSVFCPRLFLALSRLQDLCKCSGPFGPRSVFVFTTIISLP